MAKPSPTPELRPFAGDLLAFLKDSASRLPPDGTYTISFVVEREGGETTHIDGSVRVSRLYKPEIDRG